MYYSYINCNLTRNKQRAFHLDLFDVCQRNIFKYSLQNYFQCLEGRLHEEKLPTVQKITKRIGETPDTKFHDYWAVNHAKRAHQRRHYAIRSMKQP